jgi:hypothetical protein
MDPHCLVTTENTEDTESRAFVIHTIFRRSRVRAVRRLLEMKGAHVSHNCSMIQFTNSISLGRQALSKNDSSGL